ncbi:elongation of very long chain fatty acids protein F-like isoform X2 [Teleopsis dalmanni]|uniref:elongation of very long chain fatty acids protein F-like isoform X2 n=1 Tax=Teleopsis dalmanni TaxID=139649 RepID=UPI0018CF9AF2|nr:elongation of very long chain fatty acids protein F-like isoform X2 [Teleopsis dalmanni]
MFPIISHILQQIKEWDERYAVKTTTNLPIVSSPVQVIVLTVAYIIFVLKIGPYLMRNREPFNVKLLMQVYNVFQVFINLYMGFMASRLLWVPDHHNPGCITSLPNIHRLKPLESHLNYLYCFIKITDYMDTIFFVLRKSFKQITFLHVYHHVLMVLSSTMVVHYYGTGGHHTVLGNLNAFIHAWKRFITTAQIVQFIIIIVHQLWPLLIVKGCTYPVILLFSSLSQATIMLILFSKFYNKTYIKKNTKVNGDNYKKTT